MRISCFINAAKNKPQNPLSFCANAKPTAKCEKRGVKCEKVVQNTLLYTFHFSHFASIFAYFTTSVRPALNVVYTSVQLTHCAVHMRCIFSAWLINFPWAWGEQRTPGASSSLCVCAKNWQISVRGEWYANCFRTALHRFAVPSTHTRIWWTARVYEALGCFGGERNGNVTLAVTLTQRSPPKVRALFYIHFAPPNPTYSGRGRVNIPISLFRSHVADCHKSSIVYDRQKNYYFNDPFPGSTSIIKIIIFLTEMPSCVHDRQCAIKIKKKFNLVKRSTLTWVWSHVINLIWKAFTPEKIF